VIKESSATDVNAIAVQMAARKLPRFADVLSARNRIKPFLSRTPMNHYPGLSDLIGAEVFVKHENTQVTGAFKVRGGINFMSVLGEECRERGVITFSTGNHGQSMAYAGSLFEVPVKVVVPEGANPVKVESMRRYGAEILFHGNNFDDAKTYSEEQARLFGYRLVGASNEPLLIAGVATVYLEMLEDHPELDVILVPVGGGSGAAGACLVVDGLKVDCKLIATQSQWSPAAYESWKTGILCSCSNKTFAEGIAVGAGAAMTQELMRRHLSDFVLVQDDEIRNAMVWMIEKAHTLAEGAGATSLAAAYQLKEQLKGRKVGVVCTGGNSSLEHLRQALIENRE
jgi:threonine dehydratase